MFYITSVLINRSSMTLLVTICRLFLMCSKSPFWKDHRPNVWLFYAFRWSRCCRLATKVRTNRPTYDSLRSAYDEFVWRALVDFSETSEQHVGRKEPDVEPSPHIVIISLIVDGKLARNRRTRKDPRVDPDRLEEVGIWSNAARQAYK